MKQREGKGKERNKGMIETKQMDEEICEKGKRQTPRMVDQS